MQPVIGTDNQVRDITNKLNDLGLEELAEAVDELTRPVHCLIQPAIATAFGSAKLTHEDVGVLLQALGRQYTHAVSDEVAQKAAALYERIKGKPVTDLYERTEDAQEL